MMTWEEKWEEKMMGLERRIDCKMIIKLVELLFMIRLLEKEGNYEDLYEELIYKKAEAFQGDIDREIDFEVEYIFNKDIDLEEILEHLESETQQDKLYELYRKVK